MYANRGMAFEELIELSNNKYRVDMVADIEKVPTPVKILKRDKRGMISGFLEKKGTVDFQGIANFGAKPIPIAFDAKETKGKSLPFANIADHQFEYMKRFAWLGGESFILVHFSELDRYFRLRAKDLLGYAEKPWETNKKSIPLAFFESYAHEIKRKPSEMLDYLQGMDV